MGNMRCLIKSVAFASDGKYKCDYLEGETHTTADVNFYLQTAYYNALLIRPLKYGGFWNYFVLLAWLNKTPKLIAQVQPSRFALFWLRLFNRKEYNEAKNREENHCISAFANKSQYGYFEPEANECYKINYRFFLFVRIVAIYELS